MRQTLITARKAKGLTQAGLGKMIGLSNKSISAMEQGRVTGPYENWVALQNILGVDQRELRKIDCSSGVKSNAD